MSQTSSVGAVVVDANIFVSLCTKEQATYSQSLAAFNHYSQQGWHFYAPHVVVSEVMFVLCKKLQDGMITSSEHTQAIQYFKRYLSSVYRPTGGDGSHIDRANQIISGYGCSRAADCLYIALAEEMSKAGPADFLTFDKGAVNQIQRNAPKVNVNLLPI